MNNRPKVSVVIPVYNVEKQIEKCARTLFEQTLEELEFIFVDDCTPDNSVVVLEQVLNNYPMRKQQVRILHNEHNLGQGETRKCGIKASSGEYVIHCDSDDWVERNWLEELYKTAKDHDADMVWCNYYVDTGEDSRIITNVIDDDLLFPMVEGRLGAYVWLTMVKRTIVQSDKIIWPKWSFTEDLSLVYQYVLLSSRIQYIGKAFYHYIQNPNGICASLDPQKVTNNMDGFVNTLKLIKVLSVDKKTCGNIAKEANKQVFRAKDHVMATYKDDYQAMKAWLSFHPEVSFIDMLTSNLTARQKLYCLVMYSRLFPIVNKVINLKYRMWSDEKLNKKV